MRINKYLAQATGLSRRRADEVISSGRVTVNGQPAKEGQDIATSDIVTLDGTAITPAVKTTIMLNKPVGYVVSRDGQGSPTIYDLLPAEYQHLKPIGRLDKNSSGLLLLTNDGDLANELTHPSHKKTKIYQITLYKPLSELDFEKITGEGVDIGDASPSRLELVACSMQHGIWVAAAKSHAPYYPSHSTYFLPHTTAWQATLAEGRNRQIRRTFAALNYEVKTLHRTQFGDYKLERLPSGKSLIT